MKTTVNIPDDLHAEVKAIAKEQNRSLRGQIVHWLALMVNRYRVRQQEISWPGYDAAGIGSIEVVGIEEEE